MTIETVEKYVFSHGTYTRHAMGFEDHVTVTLSAGRDAWVNGVADYSGGGSRKTRIEFGYNVAEHRFARDNAPFRDAADNEWLIQRIAEFVR